ncbi:MAG: hypothetical protein UT34_C0001G0053 [candidate division WS6 bacterium GW2011_GWF2_39_15]|uniref:Carboxypeptidase regulatory-like domain-containing protein n=1 Tax=candidate division WS6 bacterium GW2011_GWF2_39_15 TaxID=1619100 RepID=A0A0G0MS61_9BACT|nr:MAG: hypothetical protein UT34_C0001G0053 [candidate division WS6 bacterium GW2011_GWF2_39_15]
MRVNRKRIIPLLVLLSLFIWYFNPEIRLGLDILTHGLYDACILPSKQERNCQGEGVRFLDEERFQLGVSQDDPNFVFKINRSINEIDLSQSSIEVIANQGALKEDTNQYVNLLVTPKTIGIYHLDDSNVVLMEDVEGNTKITLSFPKEFKEGYTVFVYLDVVDKEGRGAFGWKYATTSLTMFNFYFGNYSYLVQYLIWYVAIFGRSFKRNAWSTVYNSQTKEPILGAVVRIFRNNALISSFVTGQTGVIQSRLEKGRYKLMITHSQYTFPSRIQPLTRDGEYRNLYYGGYIEVKRDKSYINADIPLDPTGKVARRSFIEQGLTVLQSTVDFFNPTMLIFVAGFQLVVWPTYLESYVYAAIATLLIILQKNLQGKNEKTPGIILNSKGDRLPNIKINLYDGDWNKVVDSKVTDVNGEYEFIVPSGNYFLKVDSDSYIIQGLNGSGEYKVPVKAKAGKTMYVNDKLVLTEKAGVT